MFTTPFEINMCFICFSRLKAVQIPLDLEKSDSESKNTKTTFQERNKKEQQQKNKPIVKLSLRR